MKGFIVFPKLLVIVGPVFANSYIAKYLAAIRRYNDKNTPNYEDSCDYAVEERRIPLDMDIERRLAEITSLQI